MSGYKLLKKTSMFNFLKWGEYMRRAQLAERKVKKLKALMLLVDPVVSDVTMNSVVGRQYEEFIREFPDEGNPPL